MPTTMCDLASKLPLLIGQLLDRESHLKRGRFREETMTDIFTGALAAFAGSNLVIQYPVEVETGGDIDLRFWHAASGRNLFVRIQAKRLNAESDVAKTKQVKIKNRAYNELLHKPPKALENEAGQDQEPRAITSCCTSRRRLWITSSGLCETRPIRGYRSICSTTTTA
jgi:hypothetical protein